MVANIIEGNPTNKFFMEMIARDFSIEDTIMNLSDDSIDGANRINPNDYLGLNIYLTVNKDYFEIKDNCSGFSIDAVKRYAFRFGRSEDALKVNGTVGRFGFGMKRFLFKIGKNFVVESQFEQDAFKVEVDVDRWSKKVRTIINEDGTSDLSVLSVLSTPLKSLILKRRWKTSSPHSNLLLNHSFSTILQIFKTYGL